MDPKTILELPLVKLAQGLQTEELSLESILCGSLEEMGVSAHWSGPKLGSELEWRMSLQSLFYLEEFWGRCNSGAAASLRGGACHSHLSLSFCSESGWEKGLG